MSTYIAGCQYYEGIKHLASFCIDERVQLICDAQNQYDKHAVEVLLK
nr:hypothetical protein [Ningiella ruwaisensis]